MPTPEDAQAILNRAAEAAQRAETAAQQMTAARAGARQETETRFPDIPEDVVKQIAEASANTVVEAMRREFEVGAPPTPPPSDGAASTTPAPGSSPSSDSGSTSPDTSTSTDTPTPPRKNLAQRILGG